MTFELKNVCDSMYSFVFQWFSLPFSRKETNNKHGDKNLPKSKVIEEPIYINLQVRFTAMKFIFILTEANFAYRLHSKLQVRRTDKEGIPVYMKMWITLNSALC